MEKFWVAGHAEGGCGSRHPLLEPVTQHTKVFSVAFGRFGVKTRVGMHRPNEGFAVVFIEPRPLQRIWHMH